jgi:tetratricopeptide (TPR) repeat protein
MIIERHYDDEALIALIENKRAATDAHIPSCAPCRDKVESFRMIAEHLGDADVWDTRELRTEAVPATIATLRAFADRMVDEDARAALILPELLAGARDEWMPRLIAHPEWRTAGVVRGLLRAAYDAVMQMPPDAVAMTWMATDIAEHLPALTPNTLAQLRGAAWRDHAYALYYTGSFAEAEAALTLAETHFSDCVVSEYEQARLGIVRSLVLRAFERFDEATAVASASAETFAFFKDASRQASARLAQVHLLFSRSDFVTAEGVLRELDQQLCDTNEFDTHARVLGNLGYCARKLGKIEEAIRYQEMSAALHSLNGTVTEVVRVRWNIAVMLAEAGRVAEAYARLTELTPEMERLGMFSEAALNALEIAELLIVEGRYSEVEDLCRRAMAAFERAGLSYTTRAMTALAYIQEAAANRKVSRELVRTVRTYIRELPAQPNLLFAHPPE